MKAIVKFVAYSEDEFLKQSENNENFSIARLESEAIRMNGSVWTREKRVAFVALHNDVVEQIKPYPGMELPGKIIVEESIVPFYDGQAAKAKVDDEGEIQGYAVDSEGNLVFRQTKFVGADVEASDKLILCSYMDMDEEEMEERAEKAWELAQEAASTKADEDEEDNEEEEKVVEEKPKAKAKAKAEKPATRSRRK